MRSIISNGLKSRFLRSAGTISGGSAAAQVIAFACAPILTRLYSPEAYGLLALMLAFVTIGMTVVSLHYELAIALPSEEREAAALSMLALIVGAGISVLSVALFAPRAIDVLSRAGAGTLVKYWWLLPITLFFSACHQVLTFWHLRRQRYKEVAINGVVQSVSQNGAPILLGVFGFTSIGLILGVAISRIVGAGGFLLRALQSDRGVLRVVTADILSVARKYKAFPTVGLLGAVLHVGCFQLPVFILTDLYGPGIAGFYMLQDRVMGVPLAVLGQGMASVFYVNAAKLAQEDVQELKRVFFKLLRTLSVIAAVPALILLLLGPWLFSTVFGPTWRVAGEYAQIMVIPTFFRFVTGPLYRCLTILGGQKWIIVCDGIGCIALLILPALVSGVDNTGAAGIKVIAVAITLTYAGLLGAATYVVTSIASKSRQPELPATPEVPPL